MWEWLEQETYILIVTGERVTLQVGEPKRVFTVCDDEIATFLVSGGKIAFQSLSKRGPSGFLGSLMGSSP